eukprot:12380155-Heterocapsa_arctica.AAC.1
MEYLNSKPRKRQKDNLSHFPLSVFGAASKKSLQVTSRSLLGLPGLGELKHAPARGIPNLQKHIMN